jgi:hypothetical protein
VQFPTWLGHVLKSGEVSLFTGETKTLQLKVDDNRIDFNLINKDLVKLILRSEVGGNGRYHSARAMIKQFKNVARELKADELTMTVSYKGDIMLTLGSGANPKLSQLVTRTNTIEINNLTKLIEIGI